MPRNPTCVFGSVHEEWPFASTLCLQAILLIGWAVTGCPFCFLYAPFGWQKEAARLPLTSPLEGPNTVWSRAVLSDAAHCVMLGVSLPPTSVTSWLPGKQSLAGSIFPSFPVDQ